MLNNVRAKIRSVPKRLVAYWFLLLITIATALVIALYFNDTPSVNGRRMAMPKSAKTYQLLVADSPDEQKTGLGNRKQLPQNEGMLFINDRMEERCLWMKDMHFAIDIIWLNEQKRVTAIQADTQPDSYPQTYCAPAQYVIELNAGEAAKNKLNVGDHVDF
jgi:uncharacterized protein